jgi:hypothetical protein
MARQPGTFAMIAVSAPSAFGLVNGGLREHRCHDGDAVE